MERRIIEALRASQPLCIPMTFPRNKEKYEISAEIPSWNSESLLLILVKSSTLSSTIPNGTEERNISTRTDFFYFFFGWYDRESTQIKLYASSYSASINLQTMTFYQTLGTHAGNCEIYNPQNNKQFGTDNEYSYQELY